MQPMHASEMPTPSVPVKVLGASKQDFSENMKTNLINKIFSENINTKFNQYPKLFWNLCSNKT